MRTNKIATLSILMLVLLSANSANAASKGLSREDLTKRASLKANLRHSIEEQVSVKNSTVKRVVKPMERGVKNAFQKGTFGKFNEKLLTGAAVEKVIIATSEKERRKERHETNTSAITAPKAKNDFVEKMLKQAAEERKANAISKKIVAEVQTPEELPVPEPVVVEELELVSDVLTGEELHSAPISVKAEKKAEKIKKAKNEPKPKPKPKDPRAELLSSLHKKVLAGDLTKAEAREEIKAFDENREPMSKDEKDQIIKNLQEKVKAGDLTPEEAREELKSMKKKEPVKKFASRQDDLVEELTSKGLPPEEIEEALEEQKEEFKEELVKRRVELKDVKENAELAISDMKMTLQKMRSEGASEDILAEERLRLRSLLVDSYKSDIAVSTEDAPKSYFWNKWLGRDAKSLRDKKLEKLKEELVETGATEDEVEKIADIVEIQTEDFIIEL